MTQLRLYVIRTLAAAMERVERASNTSGGGGGGAEYAGVVLFVLKLLVANTDDLARETPPSAKEAQPTAALAGMDRKLDRILAREDEIMRAVRSSAGADDSDRTCRRQTRMERRGRPAAGSRSVNSRSRSASEAEISASAPLMSPGMSGQPPRLQIVSHGVQGVTVERCKSPAAAAAAAMAKAQGVGRSECPALDSAPTPARDALPLSPGLAGPVDSPRRGPARAERVGPHRLDFHIRVRGGGVP